ncbi:MAG: 30S ribosomal protein S18 [Planctomycetota bacterium]
MSRFIGGPGIRGQRVTTTTGTGKVVIDYKDIETLRRMITPNGKIHGRKKLGVSAKEQRMISQAIKRARYMGLMPYTSATM